MKHSLFTFSFLILICSSLHAQEKEQIFAKHSLGFSFSSNYTYRNYLIKKNHGYIDFLGMNPEPDDLIRIYDSMDSPAYGSEVGFSYLYQPHKNMAIETGLLLTSYAHKQKDLVLVGQFNGQFEEFGKLTIKQTFRFINIPIKLNVFYLNKEKFRLFVSGGLTNNFCIMHTNKYKATAYEGYEDQIQTGKYKDTSKPNDFWYYTGLSGSLGIDYFPLKNLMIRIEPNSSYLFYTNYRNNPDILLIMHPYSFGLNVGAYWRFGS